MPDNIRFLSFGGLTLTETKHKNHRELKAVTYQHFWSFYITYLAKIFMKFVKMKWNHKSQFFSSGKSNAILFSWHNSLSFHNISLSSLKFFINLRQLFKRKDFQKFIIGIVNLFFIVVFMEFKNIQSLK